jgi:uncharacterized protein YjbJ (UPF0337 family)
MSWDRIEGQWKQRRGKAVHHWGKLMNDQLAAIAGRYEELVGRLQEKYGIAKEEARAQVDTFNKTVNQLKKSNSKLVEMQKRLIKQNRVDRKPAKSPPPGKKKVRSKPVGQPRSKRRGRVRTHQTT